MKCTFIVKYIGYCLKWKKEKNRKTERESASDFLTLFLFFNHEYLTTYMINEISNGYVHYLYTQIKYKSIKYSCLY